MKILRFTLSGKSAMFKKPDVNSYFYFTYGQIHKPALLGIFGAVLGYAGYNQMNKESVYPEYYDKLQNVRVSIVPNADNGYFPKKITYFNNSTGFASHEQGGNLIIKEQWLEEPSWDIYVLLDSDEAEKIAEFMLEGKSVYLPYLGKNDHTADIMNVSIEEGVESNKATELHCLFIKDKAEIDSGFVMPSGNQKEPFKYEEALPIGLEPETNQYVLKKLVYTNMNLATIKDEVWSVGNRNIVFY